MIPGFLFELVLALYKIDKPGIFLVFRHKIRKILINRHTLIPTQFLMFRLPYRLLYSKNPKPIQ